MDARQLAFDSEFDAVFSNAALHWILDPGPVIAGVKRTLKRGGRFVGEFGAHGNVASIGPRPTLLPAGMEGWLDTFAQPFFRRLPAGSRAEAKEHAIRLLRPVLRNRRGNWTADYVRLRFFAQAG